MARAGRDVRRGMPGYVTHRRRGSADGDNSDRESATGRAAWARRPRRGRGGRGRGFGVSSDEAEAPAGRRRGRAGPVGPTLGWERSQLGLRSGSARSAPAGRAARAGLAIARKLRAGLGLLKGGKLGLVILSGL